MRIGGCGFFFATQMPTQILFTTQTRYRMVNTVTCKIVQRKDTKDKNGFASIVAQCFVNGQRVVLPLSIKLPVDCFDEKREFVRAKVEGAVNYNRIISDARARAVQVLSEANVANVQLNKNNFREHFTMTRKDVDFIHFFDAEIKKRVGELTNGSIRQHKASLSKLRDFKPAIPFSMLNPDLLVSFERYLIAECKNCMNTVYRDMKNIRTYTYIAMRKGLELKNPFLIYKVKMSSSRIIYCTMEEQKKLLKIYDNHEVPEYLRISLLIFLVSCFTSLRISDLRQCNAGWVEKNSLNYLPQKTKRFNKYVSIPLSEIALRLLKDYFLFKINHRLKSDQKLNDDLKVIAGYARIKKVLSMHVGRHTFATTFLFLGGTVEVLQQLLGHKKINDTMIYVHITDSRKKVQMKNFDKQFK